MTSVPNVSVDVTPQVIYVLRNPKDQAVSYYHFHQTAKYLGGEKRDWDEFLQLYLKGHLVYGSWFEHVKGWIQLAQTRPDKVMVISYEELQVVRNESIFLLIITSHLFTVLHDVT